MLRLEKDVDVAKIRDAPDFRIYANSTFIPKVTFYFIESTAPDNVEQRANVDDTAPDGLARVDTDKAIRDIAETLTPTGAPETEADLVVMVHGFNTPRPNARNFFAAAVAALKKDQGAIFSQDPLRPVVCIGYRWPSEAMFGGVLWSSLCAMPLFPRGVFLFSVAALAARAMGWVPGLTEVLTPVAVALLAAIVVLALLRAIVYFRDIYRATNYGVPDLVEVIRQIDLEVSTRVDAEAAEARKKRKRIALSFIGHSMGGRVVTNAIRVLSDVFDQGVITTTLSGARRPEFAAESSGGGGDHSEESEETPDDTPAVSSKIGHVFTLMRFLLASPDIPAETLLADRANFLRSSLERFREAYLFSSEGDEVLRMISTTANYFSFPTGDRTYGYRLGNAEILSSGFGEVKVGRRLLKTLRTGSKKLGELADATRRGNAAAAPRKRWDPAAVAKIFSYFDCTDYVDGEPPKGLLTRARNFKAESSNAGISYLEHLKLLWRYAWPFVPKEERINVHGGYFEGEVSQRLMYRLACLGFTHATKAPAYPSRGDMLNECAEHGIRVILSKRLDSEASQKEREPMDTPEIMNDRAIAEAVQKICEIGVSWRDLCGPRGITETDEDIVIGGIRIPKRRLDGLGSRPPGPIDP
ncbi:alpha/beta hydrolase [Methylocystis bryophila]|uniref:Alpha/beta hydrolase n=1 Tax=Methylocystis bryophila TaxID=655015 RepID=A0A1W6MVC8_9HYPH|nr:alpha/beta hydrolase [Methylocystis bryophila]ARN81551.1 hypothetical protein B1812_11260 [Methylocystis bryophila]BDV37581.1 hypothetical protein DSM21852_08340 [Methylocystis bryophila]